MKSQIITGDKLYLTELGMIFDEFNSLRGGNSNPYIELLIVHDLYLTGLNYVVKGGGEEAVLKKQGTDINRFNGTVILGSDPLNKMYVLLNNVELKPYFEKSNPTWKGTVFHECTHAMDYYQYAKRINITSANEILLSEPHEVFQLWSEFHARCVGMKKVNGEGIPKQNRQQVIGLLNEHWKYLIKSTPTGITSNLYLLMQCLGRFRAVEELSVFSINPFVQAFFGNGITEIEKEKIPKIYKALCDIDICDVENFFDDLSVFNELIKDL